ncbi:MAG: ATP synthase F1 subunit delta [Tissierellia bacterium]|nr:ATP synthase F1 subunit delta [Tissierellia bacterium]
MAKLKDRYANALLELSEESGSLEEDLEHAFLIRDALKGPEVQGFLLHPHIPDSDKYKLFHKAFSENIRGHLMGFLHLMVQKNRESLIVPILTEYIDRLNKRLGKIEAKVVSAKALTKKQIELIRTVLSKKMNMEVKVKTTVDPDVLGGFYILVDGRIFDRTVRSELNKMKESLKRGSYE